MNIIFDKQNEELTIDTKDIDPWETDVHAFIVEDTEAKQLNGINFDIKFDILGKTTQKIQFPPFNVKNISSLEEITSMTKDICCPAVNYRPDEEIYVEARFKSDNGHDLVTSASFVAPREKKPYESWIWKDYKWTPPEPFPSDPEKAFKWNEQSRSWVEFAEGEIVE